MNLLNVQDLAIQFQTTSSTVDAVKGISFAVQQGEIVGIVGESGSGKSVTSLAIMKLLTKKAGVTGKILLEGQDLRQCSEQEMRAYRGRKISMVFQEPMSSLNPVFRCGEQVLEALLIHQQLAPAEAKAEVIRWFEKVQLNDSERIYQSYPHELSGGQKQRIMLAMAMCCQPDLLIADEPTTALDVTVQQEILRLIRALQREQNLAVLFISHDLGVIAEIADRVVVMYRGEIVEAGNVQQIFQTPQHPYTKGLIACRPPLHRKLHRLPTIEDFVTGNDFEVREARDISHHIEERSNILKVEGLSTWFGKKQSLFSRQYSYVKAVNDVSFEMKRGETLGLVGESGSGKSTLGRSILRLVQARTGKVIFDDTSILDLPKNAMRSIRKDLQIIFQDPYSSLNPRSSIGEAILEPMTVHNIFPTRKARKEYVIELLETVGMQADHFTRLPSEFSGGQRQRICIARALALQPKFIICDECVSSLDVSVQAQVLNLLKDLQEQYRLSYLFISHDLSVVRFMSNRILVMKAGEIVEQGYANAIFEQPKTSYTKQLIEAIPNPVFGR